MGKHHRRDRGFTLVEMMIVIGVIGIIASIAIPNYQKLTARGYRSEMITAISKFKFFFKNAHDNNGTFATSDVSAGSGSEVNPNPASAALGQGTSWDGTRKGWKDMPFGLDGSIKMRYKFNVISADEVQFESCGSFPAFGPLTIPCGDMGMNGNYFYSDHIGPDGQSLPLYPVEIPNAF